MRRRDVLRWSLLACLARSVPVVAQEQPPAGPPKEPTPYDRAADWIVRHANGRGWDAATPPSSCDRVGCAPHGRGGHASSSAAHALLALFADGSTHQKGEAATRKAIQGALQTLSRNPPSDAPFVGTEGGSRLDALLAETAAFVELWGLTQSPLVRSNLEPRMTLVLRVLDPAKGFRSELRPEAPGWRTMTDLGRVLFLARTGALDLGADARPKVLEWFAARFAAKALTVAADDPKTPGTSEDALDRLAAAGLMRTLLPDDDAAVRADPALPKIADKLVAAPFPFLGTPPTKKDAPKPSPATPEAGVQGLESYFLRASFIHQVGREKDAAWVKSQNEALAALQATSGCAAGSFSPATSGTDRGPGGRLGATAYAALAFAVPWSFRPRVPTPK